MPNGDMHLELYFAPMQFKNSLLYVKQVACLHCFGNIFGSPAPSRKKPLTPFLGIRCNNLKHRALSYFRNSSQL